MFSSYSFLLAFSLLFGFLANSGLSQLRAETWRQRGFKGFCPWILPRWRWPISTFRLRDGSS